jgi:uncharacterized protein (DUF1499 family)
MGPWQTSLVVVVCVILAGVLTLALLSALARRPTGLGVHDGRLAECPNTPNCVCSQANDEPHRTEPLHFQGSPEAAMVRLRGVLGAWPRTRVVSDTEDYIHVECTSLIFRFVDDVEFLLDRASGVIHCRSASRVGHSDLGANRRRIEALREAFTQNIPYK